jgi:hypothetical protein
MKTFLPLVAILIFSFSCKRHEELHKSNCGTSATVRDLSSQSGCGFVFELADGTKISPVAKSKQVHGSGGCHGGQSYENALINFSLVEGKKVKIGYAITNTTANSCDALSAEILCIEEDTTVVKDN